MYAAMLAITIGLPLLWGERRLKIWIPYVIIFPGAVLILFTKILKVFFEPGSVISFLP
jgi:putative tricarboxylic transport membrane protein